MKPSTIIEVRYENYTENVILTKGNRVEVRRLINREDVVGYEIIQQGEVELEVKETKTVIEFLKLDGELMERQEALDNWELSGWKRREEIASYNKAVKRINTLATRIKKLEYDHYMSVQLCLDWEDFKEEVKEGVWMCKYVNQ